uniref:PB1 domain-containing protein n=1 Tax=Setaria viridis TaxID=4556 RepID=A0A4U6W3M3_SETVI|nr:hypothetical protein SEVIR_2G146100v2 [Setaria viridis]
MTVMASSDLSEPAWLLPGSRKYVGCFVISMVVDSDMFNFKDFIDEIVDKYPPGYKELVTIAYYDDGSENYLEVKSDQDMLAMFARHMDSKVVNIYIAYTLPTEIPKWHVVSKNVPNS